MERLPYIDAHERELPGPPDEAWRALLGVLRGDLGTAPPGLLVRTWRLEPGGRRGSWRRTVERGDCLPGFAVDEVTVPERLAFTGRHRFSRYALTFTLAESQRGGTTVRAETRGSFPGLLGRGYRAAVIDTRLHRLIVRRMLRRTAERL